MKILFYTMAVTSGIVGFLALVRSVESYLAGTGMNGFMILLAAFGLGLARFWTKRARALS